MPNLIILGGAFDPIHTGHLAIANTLYDKFKTPITFLPTNGTPPYKPALKTSNKERLDMLHLAISTNPQFILDTFEINQTEYSCSYKTLKYMRDQYTKDMAIFFLIG